MRIAIIKAKKLALRMGISQSEAKKAAEDSESEEESKFLTVEAAGEGENQMRGDQQEMWYKYGCWSR